eukprot:scaffold81813_cov28-Tisochrysis_lutea.AAC.3
MSLRCDTRRLRLCQPVFAPGTATHAVSGAHVHTAGDAPCGGRRLATWAIGTYHLARNEQPHSRAHARSSTQAGVFSGTLDPNEWVSTGLAGYTKNWDKDVSDLVKVWAPADIVCFSVPLWLRLPVRHIVSFVWTAYLSFIRGSK